MLSHVKRLAGALLVTAVLMTSVSAQTIVYSNNPAPGDDVTNPTSSFGLPVPVGSSGWYYSNVVNNGHVGIRTDLPRSGNGSVWFKGTQGPTPVSDSSKADIEFWSATPLGTLNDLSQMGYEWYRKSGAYTATNYIHPSLRVWVANNTNPLIATSKGYLVFERVYNVGPGAAPTDTWTAETIGDSTVLWSTGSLPDAFSVYNRTLAQWKSLIGNYYIFGFSSGIGRGWGTFEGAVDNISWTINNQTASYNFEVVPEPATMALFGLGLAAVGGLVRRKKA